MRKKLEQTLIDLVSKDKNIYLLVNDLGSFESFRKLFPNNFINCGIGEPNMVSVAAGLSLSGNHPIIYSVAGFCIHRGFEQLKFDICYNDLDLTIVNAAAGLCYNRVGGGHYLVDDFAIMQTLPNISIYAPIDIPEFDSFFRKSVLSRGVSYIRTGLDGCSDIPTIDNYVYNRHSDTTIVTTGVFSEALYRVCYDIDVNVYHMGKLSKKEFSEKIIVVEDHIKFGGLCSFITGDIVDHICLPNVVSEMAETRDDLLKKYGLDDESLRKKIISNL